MSRGAHTAEQMAHIGLLVYLLVLESIGLSCQVRKTHQKKRDVPGSPKSQLHNQDVQCLPTVGCRAKVSAVSSNG